MWVLDEAYRSHIYDNYDYYWMDKSIDWTSKFYQGKLEKYDLRCDQGKDIRILFQFSTDDYTISKYYFELIKQDNNWYLLSVFS
ncbi:MAG: hypothetical protein IJ091_09020 [Oscillospiraceae bacterium]|nr:hypothetical protein [Oscillospiraceae bacterium]